MNDINNEVSQGSGEIPIILFNKQKEYLLPSPRMDLLYKHISSQEDKKTYSVNRESMIKYEDRKYSVPTRYIGERMTVTTDDSGNLSIYYNNGFVVCHAVSSMMYKKLEIIL